MLAVQNKEKGPTVFSDPPNNIVLEWQGRGAQDGGDVQYVPDTLIENPAFNKMLQKGILALIAIDQVVDTKIQQQVQNYQQRRDVGEALTEAVMDRSVETPLVVATVDEKGGIEAQSTPRTPDQVNLNPPSDVGPVEIPEEPQTRSESNVVQVDEEGHVITSPQEIRVVMESPQKEI